MKPLTKSRLADFEQCEKRFWLALHRPDLAAPRDVDVFVAGHAVGAIARANLPTGPLAMVELVATLCGGVGAESAPA